MREELTGSEKLTDKSLEYFENILNILISERFQQSLHHLQQFTIQ